MEVITKVVIDIESGEVEEKEAYEYDGPVALCYWQAIMAAASAAMQAYDLSRNKPLGANKEDVGGGLYELPDPTPVPDQQIQLPPEIGIDDGWQGGEGVLSEPSKNPIGMTVSQDLLGGFGQPSGVATGSSGPPADTGEHRRAGGASATDVLTGLIGGTGTANTQIGDEPPQIDVAEDGLFDNYNTGDYLQAAQIAGSMAQGLSNRTSGAGAGAPQQWNPQPLPQGPQVGQVQPPAQQGPVLANDRSGYIDLLGQLQAQAMGPYYQQQRYPRRQYGY